MKQLIRRPLRHIVRPLVREFAIATGPRTISNEVAAQKLRMRRCRLLARFTEGNQRVAYELQGRFVRAMRERAATIHRTTLWHTSGQELERLCSTLTHSMDANQSHVGAGKCQVMLQIKGSHRDGTTHIMISTMEFMRRLAALVLRLYLDLICSHSDSAPRADVPALRTRA